jgi:hypothetical protein
MAKYRKKPVVIEAVQLRKDNVAEVRAFLPAKHAVYERIPQAVIYTPEGEMLASEGDWIICGVNGEFYPCKDDVFQKTYEPA